MMWRKNKVCTTAPRSTVSQTTVRALVRLCGMISRTKSASTTEPPTFFPCLKFESTNYFPPQPAMGRKRKAEGRSSAHEEPADITQEKALLRINTYKDVADSEDEFFDNQEKILLDEGPAQKRQRKAQEDGIKNGFSGICCTND